MNECKCGRIPPCYGSLERAIYEEAKKVNDEWEKSCALHGKLIDKLRGKLMEGGFLDDTHDKVYGVNKQMCDLGKTILTKNKDIMEEKKTKKMTKAEAFEYLKEKKVLCKDYDKMEAIQDFARSLGFHWSDYSVEPMLVYVLFLEKDGRLAYSVSQKWFEGHKYEERSADDILSIEVVEEKNGEEGALDLISTVGARLSEVLRRMKGHKHIVITEDDVILYDEGMSLFHSDPF